MTLDWTQLVAPGYTTDYEMLMDLYVTKDMSLLDLEEHLGVSHNTIGRRLRFLGISKERTNGKTKKGSQGLQLSSSAGLVKDC
jgi:transcriptional antiterminator